MKSKYRKGIFNENVEICFNCKIHIESTDSMKEQEHLVVGFYVDYMLT